MFAGRWLLVRLSVCATVHPICLKAVCPDTLSVDSALTCLCGPCLDAACLGRACRDTVSLELVCSLSVCSLPVGLSVCLFVWALPVCLPAWHCMLVCLSAWLPIGIRLLNLFYGLCLSYKGIEY